LKKVAKIVNWVVKKKIMLIPLETDYGTYFRLSRACLRAFEPAAGAARRGQCRSILLHGSISASESPLKRTMRLT
jgi:hypothetical protein